MKFGTKPVFLLPFRSPIAVFLGLTAIIVGILGMHFLSGSHHEPATAVTAHTSAAADSAAGESSTQHSTASGQGLTGDAGGVSGNGCSEPCSGEDGHTGVMCILMIVGLIILLLIPKALSLRRRYLFWVYPYTPGSVPRLPPAPSLTQLCISRT